MTNQEARKLNTILKSITFKTIGDELFMPMIELLDAVSEINKKYGILEMSIIDKLGLSIDQNGMVLVDTSTEEGIAVAKKANTLINNLSNEYVDVNATIINIHEFKKLSDENPKIVGGDLLFLKKILVK